MTLDDALDFMVRAAHWFKTELAYDEHKGTDLAPVAFCFRGLAPVATVAPDKTIMGRLDVASYICRLAVRNYAPDIIGVFYEVVLNHGKQEALAVQVYNQAGDHHVVLLPYSFPDGRLAWGPVEDFGRGSEEAPAAFGMIVKLIHAEFHKPSVPAIVAQEGLTPQRLREELGLDFVHPEEMQALQDCAGAYVLGSVMHVETFLLAEPGSVREQTIAVRAPERLVRFGF